MLVMNCSIFNNVCVCVYYIIGLHFLNNIDMELEIILVKWIHRHLDLRLKFNF